MHAELIFSSGHQKNRCLRKVKENKEVVSSPKKTEWWPLREKKKDSLVIESMVLYKLKELSAGT